MCRDGAFAIRLFLQSSETSIELSQMKLPKSLLKLIGAVLVLSYFVPIPFGSMRLVAGLSILVCASLPFALFVQASRRKYGWLNRPLTWMENKLGERWAGNLMVTRPENDPRTHFSDSTPSAASPQSDDNVRREKD